MFSYDAVTYPSQPLPQAHPDRLATIATLLGLHPASVKRCRYLELGAGDGIHLISCALNLPNSTFVGVDLSEAAILRGRGMIERLGLPNVSLHYANLMDWSPEGEFDYIMAHGLYSWVPSVVRDRVMAVASQHLAPEGIAYISYNTLPGGHIRRMLWEMMKFHTRNVTDPAQRVEQSVSLLQFLSAGHPKATDEDGFPQLLRKEVQNLMNRRDKAVLYHDDLADINDPIYVRDFAAHAASHGLRFLSEADYYETQSSIYPKEIAAVLRNMAEADPVLKEQYLDFLKCRRFRQTLLCHVNRTPEYNPSPNRVRLFAVTSLARPTSESPDLSPGIAEQFAAPRGGGMKIDLPLAKAAMLILAETAPHPIPFAELVASAQRILGQSVAASADDEEALTHILLGGYTAGLLEFHSHIPRYAQAVSEKPLASPVARLQLQDGMELVTSLLHTPVLMEVPVTRLLLQLLDGTRDRTALVEELAKHVSPPPEQDSVAFAATLAKSIDDFLLTAAQRGLLLA